QGLRRLPLAVAVLVASLQAHAVARAALVGRVRPDRRAPEAVAELRGRPSRRRLRLLRAALLRAAVTLLGHEKTFLSGVNGTLALVVPVVGTDVTEEPGRTVPAVGLARLTRSPKALAAVRLREPVAAERPHFSGQAGR